MIADGTHWLQVARAFDRVAELAPDARRTYPDYQSLPAGLRAMLDHMPARP